MGPLVRVRCAGGGRLWGSRTQRGCRCDACARARRARGFRARHAGGRFHESTGMPLDVVLAGSGLEDEFLQRAVPTDIGGTRVPIIELSDLIIAKVLAGGRRDRSLAAASAGGGCAADSTHPPAAGGGPEPERPGIELRADFQLPPVVSSPPSRRLASQCHFRHAFINLRETMANARRSSAALP